MRVTALDHLVLTVADLDATVAFYERLGMVCRRFGDGRLALHFGRQKVNLHRAGAEFEPHARRPERGAADLCFLVDEPIAAVERTLGAAGIEIELGPVERDGAQGSLESVYVRDPDGNLIELLSRGRGVSRSRSGRARASRGPAGCRRAASPAPR